MEKQKFMTQVLIDGSREAKELEELGKKRWAQVRSHLIKDETAPYSDQEYQEILNRIEELESVLKTRRHREAIRAKWRKLITEIGLEFAEPFTLKDRGLAAFAVREAISSPPANGSHGNIILHGPPGTGKTRVLARILKKLLYREMVKSVEWITGSQFADLVSSLGIGDERAEARQRLARLGTVELLAIDDLASVHFTGARISALFKVLDARYRNRLPTFITTNCNEEQMDKMLSAGEDPAIGERILRRLAGTIARPTAYAVEFKRPATVNLVRKRG